MIKFEKFNWWRFLLSVVIFAVIAQIVHTLSAFISMGYYELPAYASVWSKLMMPHAGPPPASFMLLSFIYSLVGGIIFAGFYLRYREAIHRKTEVKKGLCYGMSIFFLATIPSSLMLHLLINMPFMLIIYWTLEMLIIYLVNGMIVAKLNK